MRFQPHCDRVHLNDEYLGKPPSKSNKQSNCHHICLKRLSSRQLSGHNVMCVHCRQPLALISPQEGNMKTILVIDDAENCAYDHFLAADDFFAVLFPEDGQDIEFIEDF